MSSTIHDTQPDTWHFGEEEPVPAWLLHLNGVRRAYFVARTTVFTTLDGGFVVMPHKQVAAPVMVEGYGPTVLMELRFQGLRPVRLLDRPIGCLPTVA